MTQHNISIENWSINVAYEIGGAVIENRDWDYLKERLDAMPIDTRQFIINFAYGIVGLYKKNSEATNANS